MIDLSDAGYWRDPYPILERERALGAITYTNTGEPALLLADDAELLHTDRHFSTPGLLDLERLGICDGPFYEWRARTLNVMNGPDHERLRSYVGRAFFPAQIRRLRGLVRERANALLDRVAETGEIEFISGIDEADRLEIGSFLTGTEEGFTQQMTPELRRRVEQSIVALNTYVADLIERRAREPKDDIVSSLVQLRDSGGGPAEDEMLALVVNIIGGSVGSTRAAFANSMLLFAQHRDQAEKLRQNPELAKQAVEECLRMHPPFRIARRKAIAPIEAFGLKLEIGNTILVPKQGANRDPARWERPNEFDIARPERRHLSFGYGAHFCLGQAIARANLQEALPIVLNRLRNIEVARQPERVPFTMDEQLDGLHLKFTAARGLS